MAAVITQPAEAASNGSRLLIRGLLLLGILASELIGITYLFEAPAVRDDPRWSAYLFTHSKELWRIGLWVIGSYLLLLTPRLKASLRTLCEPSSEYRWSVWLILQLLSFAAFSLITALIFESPIDPARLSASWLAGWLALASATLVLWLLALAPGPVWWRWVSQTRLKLLLGVLLGVGAWMVIRFDGPLAQEAPWKSLAGPTLRLVYWLLGWIYPDRVYQPEAFVVGTASFPVQIIYGCSGYEGISLITLFLALYCWLFRQDLRFPQAFWLFPLERVMNFQPAGRYYEHVAS
jgi:hypothetical protein